MYTADGVAEELKRYRVFVKGTTIRNYDAKFLITRSVDGLYPEEAIAEMFASYMLIHRRFLKLDYIQVSTARAAVLAGNADTGVKSYTLPKEWLALKNSVLRQMEEERANAKGSVQEEDSKGEDYSCVSRYVESSESSTHIEC